MRVQLDVFDSSKPAVDASVFVEIVDHRLPHVEIVRIPSCLNGKERERAFFLIEICVSLDQHTIV